MIDNKALLTKIKNKKAVIGVIGLGYVGLPLALAIIKKGYTVHGYVKSSDSKKTILSGATDITDEPEILLRALKKNKFSVSTTTTNLEKCDVIILCIPTPVKKNKKPDLTSLKNVASKLATINLSNKLIINESTVAPFTTHQILGKLPGDYFLVCSPERIDPGTNKTIESIPKVVGGANNESLALGIKFYEQILEKKVVKVSSMEAAELTKMLENTYRAVNIALINEFAKLADTTGIDMMDVIAAAGSKWSFATHYPGIGVGGHCIPVDPYYILEFAKKKNISMDIIKTSLQENESMPSYVLQKIHDVYKHGMEVVIYGLTYKKNVADLRESPVLTLCDLLKKHKIPFSVYDPVLSKRDLKKLGYIVSQIKPVDIFIVGADHKALADEYVEFVNENTIIIDGRNFFTKKVGKKIIGIGRTIAAYEKK